MAAPRSPAPLRCLCARWGGETRQHRGAGDDGCGSPIWEVISAAPLNYCSLRTAWICLYCLAQREERTGLVKAPETPRNCSKYCSYKFSSLLQRLRAARGVDSTPLSTLCARPPARVPPCSLSPRHLQPLGCPHRPSCCLSHLPLSHSHSCSRFGTIWASLGCGIRSLTLCTSLALTRKPKPISYPLCAFPFVSKLPIFSSQPLSRNKDPTVAGSLSSPGSTWRIFPPFQAIFFLPHASTHLTQAGTNPKTQPRRSPAAAAALPGKS